MIDADNQQERLLGNNFERRSKVMKKKLYMQLRKMKGHAFNSWFAGFVDGEGSFNVSFAKHPTTKSGWIILTKFQVYQHKSHQGLLELFQETLGTGKIYEKSGSDVLTLTIESRRNLTEKIIPFFKCYPLATKQEAFEKFKTIIEMLNNGEHLRFEGFSKIVHLAHSMNVSGRFRIHSIDEILESAKKKIN